MIKEFIVNSSEDMIKLGYLIGKNLKPNMVIALDGDLGAGKTTFTKGIAKALAITQIVNSPTFVIMKIYEGSMTLYHLDVYRTNDDEFALSEYFENDGVCIVEWAENVSSLLPKDTIYAKITDLGDNKRKMVFDTIYDSLFEGVNL